MMIAIKKFSIRTILYLIIILTMVIGPAQFAIAAPNPVVAIHVSELTQALETMPAQSPTPTGSGTSGNEWWYTSWHYFVAYESLKEALRSDGTPFVEVSDTDITAGKLLFSDGSPRYPIVISLASEAISDTEISTLRNYVNAGGFLLVGSSAFTRNPDGTSRGDFALANEMGVHMVNPSHLNWGFTMQFEKVADHRLVSNIPDGLLKWRIPLSSDEIPWGKWPNYTSDKNHHVWQVHATDATVLIQEPSEPLLMVKNYGNGQFIYHSVFQPILGHGSYDSGTYNYLIFRNAIEWAFESAKLPIIKLSPWQYQYDAALVVRHDFENDPVLIRSIENSAAFEQSFGAKGDYYFSTGALREQMADKLPVISSLQRAVSNYGATIGSHNGGLTNPNAPGLDPFNYVYFHWGPDEALDLVPAGYSSGKDYAKASISLSYQDIEGWLAGFDNGRSGCGLANNCPRTWASPFFNSTREDSYDILQQLGVVSMGEQKISPFPHWTMSTKTLGKYYSTITLPVSDWYYLGDILQALDYHTFLTMTAAVDFYYDLGALINIYGHNASQQGTIEGDYVAYSTAKPRIWATNAVEINDWWRLRSNITVTQNYSISGNTAIAQTTIAGATDSATAVEIDLQPGARGNVGILQVFFDGSPANPSDYRITQRGLKLKVGTSVSSVEVRYPALVANNLPPVATNDTYSTNVNTTLTKSAPGVLSNDTDPQGATLTAQMMSAPSHGSLTLNTNGSFTYTPLPNYVGSDSFTYIANNGTSNSNVANVAITVTSTSSVLFSDDFMRQPNTGNALSPWIPVLGSWTVANGVMQGSNSPSTYAAVYYANTPTWTDYSIESQVQFPSGAFGGGIGGRVNSSTGARYSAWIYPDGSVGGANTLKLVKFSGWTIWSGTPMQQINLPSVGTGSHTLKMVFSGSNIQVFYDGALMINVTDNNFDSRAPYLSGGISSDMWTYTNPYVMELSNVIVQTLPGSTQSPISVNDAYSTNENTTLTQSSPGVLSNDTDPQGATLTAQIMSVPSHGALTLNANGSFAYTPLPNYVGSDSFTYVANNGISNSNVASVTITVTSTSGVLFSDDFMRQPNTDNSLSPWIPVLGSWTVANGVMQGSSSPSTYAAVYYANTPTWTDYSVESQVQFPSGAFGGGMGGRVNSATGARYSAWIYPDGSIGGSNVLKLVKFRDWTTWSGTPMQQINLPSVGTGPHTLKMVFSGSNIQVFYDGVLMINVTDNNFDSRAPYLSGGVSGDKWTYTNPYLVGFSNVVVRTLQN